MAACSAAIKVYWGDGPHGRGGMDDQRRYSGDEIERIFERALTRADSERRVPHGNDGLTLAELQAIGEEVGVPRARIAAAASALDRAPAGAQLRRTAGLPLQVGLTAPLTRAPDDAEWERMVADLRETFGARGRVDRQGGLRQWTNGNLFALVEPGPDGPRLRMGTRKGSAQPLLLGGSFMLGLATLLLALGIFIGVDGPAVLMLGAIGLVLLAVAAVPLPAWAGERQRQMEEVAARWTARLAEP